MNLYRSINKKTLFILFILSFCLKNSYAQDSKTDFWDNVRYGGGFGLNFGNGFFSATVAPSAFYEFNKNLALGLGVNATINNLKGTSKSTILGGSLIGIFSPIREIQLSGEFEQLNVNRRYNVNVNLPDDNYWIPALYVGAGYRSGNVIFGIRYDVLFDENNSIFADPWTPFVRFFF